VPFSLSLLALRETKVKRKPSKRTIGWTFESRKADQPPAVTCYQRQRQKEMIQETHAQTNTPPNALAHDSPLSLTDVTHHLSIPQSPDDNPSTSISSESVIMEDSSNLNKEAVCMALPQLRSQTLSHLYKHHCGELDLLGYTVESQGHETMFEAVEAV
jgi:hypothetical protein